VHVQTGKRADAPSVDRIIPEKGYIISNLKLTTVSDNSSRNYHNKRKVN